MSFPINTVNTPMTANVSANAVAKPVVTNTTLTASSPVAPVQTVPPVSASLGTITPQPQAFSLPSASLPPAPLEDPTIGLKALGGALALGVPTVMGLERLYKDMGTGNSLIERGLARLDKFPGIKHLGQAIDWVGNQYTAATGKTLSPRLQAWIDYANPSIDQFLQRKLPGVVLHDHANDYFNLLSHLTPTQASKDGLKDLRATIASKVKAYEAIAGNIPLQHYTNAPGHSLAVTETLLNDIKRDIHTHIGWAENGLNEAAIDEAVLKANRNQLLTSFDITEKELIAAGFRGDKLKQLQEGKSLKAIQGELKQGFFKRLFQLDGPTKRAAKTLNTKLAQAVKYQRRMAGVAERLTGMSHTFIPVYEADRVLSTSLKNKKPVVGAVSRFIGGLINDVRDSFNGALIGVNNSATHVVGGGRFMRAITKASMKAIPWIAPVLIFKGPVENALKADNGDKIKTFLYDLITKEVPLMLAFIIGVKYLHEISFIKHVGTFIQFLGRNVGVSPWLKGLGNLLTNKAGFTSAYPALARVAKPFERFNVGRLASSFFAMTGSIPFFGRITRGGFALMAILPSAIFGSRFEKRFTWLAKHSIGTPESVRKAKAAEKDSEAAALKQKLPAAFFNQSKDAGASSPLTGNNPFHSGVAPVNGTRPVGIPLTNPPNFQQLVKNANGPLPLANGAAPLGPNAIPARGLTNDRTPANVKNPSTPATKPVADDSKTNPFGTFDANSINPVAIDLIAQDEALKLKTEAYVKKMGLEELVGSHH